MVLNPSSGGVILLTSSFNICCDGCPNVELVLLLYRMFDLIQNALLILLE